MCCGSESLVRMHSDLCPIVLAAWRLQNKLSRQQGRYSTTSTGGTCLQRADLCVHLVNVLVSTSSWGKNGLFSHRNAHKQVWNVPIWDISLEKAVCCMCILFQDDKYKVWPNPAGSIRSITPHVRRFYNILIKRSSRVVTETDQSRLRKVQIS